MFLFYQVNVCIFLFAFIAIYIVNMDNKTTFTEVKSTAKLGEDSYRHSSYLIPMQNALFVLLRYGDEWDLNFMNQID